MTDATKPLGRPRKMADGRSVNIYLPADLTIRLREAAAAQGKSMSAFVREACERYIGPLSVPAGSE